MYRLREYHSKGFDLAINDRDEREETCYSVLIGANGSGKSRLLGELARSFVGEVPDYHLDSDGQPARVLAVSNMVMDTYPYVSRENDRYRYLGLRQSSNSMTTGAIAASLGRFFAESLLIPNQGSNLDELASQLNLPRMHIGLGRVASAINKRSPLDTLPLLERDIYGSSFSRAQSLEAVDRELSQLAMRVRSRRAVSMPREEVVSLIRDLAGASEVDASTLLDLMRRVYGLRFQLLFGDDEDMSFEPSAGQSLLLSMFLRIASAVRPGSLILIDEPEIGLHPEWQSSFIDLLKKHLSNAEGSHFLIATHSPYVALAARTISVPDPQAPAGVHGFTGIGVNHQGMSVEMLIYQVFGAQVIGNASVNSDLTTVIDWISSNAARPGISVVAAAQRLSAIAGPHTPTLNAVLREFREQS
ncbi:ATP-binding protein [Microbacterium sp. NPDC008134]|uniref:ATP-binding protein n=1 Tax=Microbacterium sp. NPDC008134 TaxID=3364183 RepID=UPI0036EE1086